MYLVSRTETFAKLFFLVSFSGLFMYVALAFYSFHTAYSSVALMSGYRANLRDLSVEALNDNVKFILLWTVHNNTIEVQEGQTLLLDNECGDVNCYITTNKSLLNGHYENFDAIVFNVGNIFRWLHRFLPKKRSPHQKYVFYSRLPSNDFPVCSITTDKYFNWTWSYKIGSDVFNPFIEVKDLNGTVVAPSAEVKWRKNSEVSTSVLNNIDEVNTKTKAVIFLIKNCELKEVNMISVQKLQAALEEHFLSLDIYGCGNMPCPPEGCLAAIRKHYYFYLTIENSGTEDYLTEEVLMAYDHDSVPILVGSTDYTKFLPDGSYINYKGLNEVILASTIAHTIKTPLKYREYFNWKKLYTIHSVHQNKGFCQLCTLLNDQKKVSAFSTYDNFRQWWYHGSLRDKCLPKGAETLAEILPKMISDGYKTFL